jgi:hypothetical protein
MESIMRKKKKQSLEENKKSLRRKRIAVKKEFDLVSCKICI